MDNHVIRENEEFFIDDTEIKTTNVDNLYIYKHCRRCNKNKIITEFNKNKRTKDGYQIYCRVCTSKINSAYYARMRNSNPIKLITNKTCKKCGLTKPISEFATRTVSKDKYSIYCRTCCKKYAIQYRKDNPRCYYKSLLSRLYDLTPEEFNTMYIKQDGKCLLCGNKFKSRRDCHVDHSHKNNLVRGLLCHTCNVGLGMFKDDVNLLRKAIHYLSK